VIIHDVSRHLRPGLPQTTFCPGCGHGIILNSLLAAVDSLGLDMRKVVFVSGIGCAAWIPSPHINADTLHTLHGRAIACATGVKLANPELTVIVVSGDGDLSSIGGNHLIHAARRNFPLAVVCANNQIYGMTGGQTASTTPLKAITTTTPEGNPYRPFDLVNLVMAAGAGYAARWPVSRPVELTRALKRAITAPAFSFVDVMSPCPTHFGRMNHIAGGAVGLHRYLDELCLTRERAEKLPREERERRIVVGEWTDG
jgi:2-oxoglutarate/2-oxoacid ferredoxin oxidoreductase subunit beta